jgi:hypothetical protein
MHKSKTGIIGGTGIIGLLVCVMGLEYPEGLKATRRGTTGSM